MYTLELTEQEVNKVLTGLSRLAYIDSAETINKIKVDCAKQNAEKTEETE
jgi:hypothetical protein